MRLAAAPSLPLVIALAAPVSGQQPEAATPAVLIRNVTIVDPGGSMSDMDVVLRDGIIESVDPTVETRDTVAFEGRVVDGTDRYLIPGLVDAHVHVAHQPRAEIVEQLEWLLEGGVTSVRDMAGDARTLAGIQRDLITGQVAGPSLYYAALMAGPAFMADPRLEEATVGYASGESPYMVPVTPDTDLVRAVAMAKGTGATGLKLYAALDADVVRALTSEAHRMGLEVWAHSAIFPAKPVAILEAGVDVVSHAPYVIWEAAPPTNDFTLRSRGDFRRIRYNSDDMDRVIEAMVAHGTVMDPTLFVFEKFASADPSGRRLEWAADFTRRAHEAGVAIAAGTDDAGVPLAGELPNLHRELELLVELADFTDREALAAATFWGARALGQEARIGSVTPGKVADLVLLAEDPTEDIRNTRTIVHVIKAGRFVR